MECLQTLPFSPLIQFKWTQLSKGSTEEFLDPDWDIYLMAVLAVIIAMLILFRRPPPPLAM